MSEKMFHEEYRIRKIPFDPSKNTIQIHCAFRSCWKPGFTGRGAGGQYAIYSLVKSGRSLVNYKDHTYVSNGPGFSATRTRQSYAGSTSLGPEDFVRKCVMVHHNDFHEMLAGAFIPEEKAFFPLTDPGKVESVLDRIYEELSYPEVDDALLAGLFHQMLQEATSQQQGKSVYPEKLKNARRFIRNHLHDPDLCREMIASSCGLSVRTLSRLFQQYFRCGVTEYIIRSRMEQVKSMLTLPGLTIKEIALRSGFRNAAFLTSVFGRFFNETPSTFRKNLFHGNNHS